MNSHTIPERKKNGVIRSLVERAIDVIDCELDFIKMELEHPEGFVKTIPAGSVPKPLAKWNGSVAERLEYTIPIWASGKLCKPDGEPMTWADAVDLVKTVFGITVADLYDRKTKILSRQKSTCFIDEMRRVFMEEVKKSVK